jgi:hypothetical protein
LALAHTSTQVCSHLGGAFRQHSTHACRICRAESCRKALSLEISVLKTEVLYSCTIDLYLVGPCKMHARAR